MGTKSDDIEAVRTACLRWMKYDNRSQLVQRNFLEFAEWLGDPMTYNPESDTWNRPSIVDMDKPEIRRKVEIINSSPNWYALLKVMEARK